MKTVVSPELFSHKAISAFLALLMHVVLLMLLVLGVQWATERPAHTSPMSIQLWSSADFSDALNQGTSANMIQLEESEPTVEETLIPPEPSTEVMTEATVIQPSEPVKPLAAVTNTQPVESSQPVTQAQKPAKPIVMESSSSQASGDISVDTPQKPEAQNKPAETVSGSSEPKPDRAREAQLAATRQELAQAQREQLLRERLAQERAALGGGSGSSAGREPAGGMGGVLAAREETIYKDKVRAIISANIRYDPNFLERLQGNPQAIFVVRLLPDGTIGSVILKQSSGNPTFDRVVNAAIDKTGRLPLPDRPEMLRNREVILSFRPKDHNE